MKDGIRLPEDRNDRREVREGADATDRDVPGLAAAVPHERDLVDAVAGTGDAIFGIAAAAKGYLAVYSLEILLLLVTVAAAWPLVRATALQPARGLAAPAAGSGSPTV